MNEQRKDTRTMKNYLRNTLVLLAAAATAAHGEIVIQRRVDPPRATNTTTTIVVPPPSTGDSSITEEPGAGEATAEDTLVFANEDQLHGALAQIDEDGVLTWKHPAAKAPIPFTLGSMTKILLRRTAGKASAPAALVYLTNDDALAGEIVRLDAEQLVLRTWYAGEMNIPRAMIAKIEPNQSGALQLLEGPGQIADWVSDNETAKAKGWKVEEQALVGTQNNAPIARTLKGLPEAAQFDFTMQWVNYPNFQFMFYLQDASKSRGNGYSLRVSGTSVMLYRISENQGTHNIGRAEISTIMSDGQSKAQFTVLASRTEKKIILMVNGVPSGNWTDNSGWDGTGEAIAFWPQNPGATRITDLRVTRWDGQIPKGPVVAESALEKDLVQLANGDKVSGTLKGIAAGNLSLETGYGAMSIPMDRVAELRTATADRARARRNEGDIRAHFADRGQVTLKLHSLKEGVLTGSSENFGEAKMPIGAFRALDFNIYNEAKPQ